MITQKTLIMLYYSLIYSRIQYGIVLWGTAAKARLQEINARLNNIVRSITRSGKYAPATPLYKHLNILKLDDIYRLEPGLRSSHKSDAAPELSFIKMELQSTLL